MADVGLFGRDRPRGFLCLGVWRADGEYGSEPNAPFGRWRSLRAGSVVRGSLRSFGDEKMSPQDDKSEFPRMSHRDDRSESPPLAHRTR